MTFDFTVNVGTMLTLALGFGAGVAAWVTALTRITAHDKTLADMAITFAAIQATYKMLSERVEDIRAKSAAELADFKLEVAKHYATNTAISEVEKRIVVAIDRLGDRFDKIIDGQGETRQRRT